VNKSELVKSLAEKAEITQKDAAKALDATVEVIHNVRTIPAVLFPYTCDE
jgi:nucleoid DNA-binding protein